MSNCSHLVRSLVDLGVDQGLPVFFHNPLMTELKIKNPTGDSDTRTPPQNAAEATSMHGEKTHTFL